MTGKIGRLMVAAIVLGCLLMGLSLPISAGFRPGPLLEPFDGLYRTAALADDYGARGVGMAGLTDSVRIERDERGVPHIYASSDRDAIMALGYVTAQDRLFQIDFVARAASGRLAEVLGAGALPTDLFFRRIGLRWAARKNADWIHRENREQEELISWYQAGANAWIRGLSPEDDPFEFRLLGYRPRLLQIEDALAVLLYMSYDLSYTEKDLAYTRLKSVLSPEDYDRLYPKNAALAVPIVDKSFQETALEAVRRTPDLAEASDRSGGISGFSGVDFTRTGAGSASLVDIPLHDDLFELREGLLPGKGSNNWAVDGTRSTTGHPILAGDMHLALSLPAIWYEAHLVTPTMNVYGVTTPGAPVIIEGITPSTAWAFTNTGSDQIDFYRLQVTPDRTGYYVDGELELFDLEIDTVRIARGTAVIDTVRISRFGPVTMGSGGAMATRWAALDSSRTMLAIWKMGHARDYDGFQDATRYWDSPMQNILFAGSAGTVAIRSTGYLPMRTDHDGSVVLDGSTERYSWTGRVPFDELPALISPQKGFVTSTNQPPAGPTYPYYLGNDWREAYRSIRIDQLLRSSDLHSVDDIKSYQSDVHAVQADLFRPLLEQLRGLSESAESVRNRLVSWSGSTSKDQVVPIVMDSFLKHLYALVWDEPVIQTHRLPSESTLLSLLTDSPESLWFDIQGTDAVETGREVLSAALDSVAAELRIQDENRQTPQEWGDVHKLMIRHLTRSAGLKPLWRGPYPYPGYRETLSPASQLESTHSASWRVVVDFSTSPPSAYGVYPGGQSGNPFSVRYDNQIDTYLSFQYYSLHVPAEPSSLPPESILHDLVLSPASDP